MSSFTTRLLQGILVGGTAAALAIALWAPGWLDGAENLSWKLRVRALARPSTHTPDIKLILLDQSSLDWGESVNQWGWPWPREALAAIIDFCSDAGVRAVVLDVMLSESSIHDVFQDEILADAIDRAENVATAVALGRTSGSRTGWPDFVSPPAPIAGLAAWPGDAGAVDAPRATFPVPKVARMSAALGNVMAARDAQTEVTRAPVFRLFDGHPIPSLGLAAYLAAYPEAPLSIDHRRLHAGRTSLPIDDRARTILRYRGRSSVYPTYSAAAVLQSRIRILEGGESTLDPEVFKDAWVIYGYSAPALLDLRPTPLSPVAPGAVIHATLLDNLLAGDALRDAGRAGALACILLPALVAGLWVRLGTRARHAVAAILVLLPLPLAIGFAGYAAGLWIPVAAPTLGVLAALIGGITVNYAIEGRARAFIKNAFQHYLSPTVIEQILEDPQRLQLGGERRELTIFFSDLQGFSSFSETMDPQDLTALLNDYLSDMTSIILDEDGTLDKYEGDAIIAFWNAPIDQPDHAARACRAALACQCALEARREEFRKRTGHELKMRIGIHTGPVVVGNMGSHERFDYTVLGDAANLASRLEGANKVFGTYTMVSEATWSAAGAAARGRRLGRIRVVGRATPVQVFELSDEAGDDLAAGLAAFDEGDLAAAVDALALRPEDPVARAYLERCRAGGEVAEWDPVWNLAAK